MAFYLSYFFLALPSSFILKKTGMKKGMGLGLFVMAIGAVMFGQFVTMRVYPGALTGLFVIGAGLSLLQTASNPYISILGPIESGAQRIAFMGICNKLAGAAAPFVFSAVVLSNIATFDKQIAAAGFTGREGRPARRLRLQGAHAVHGDGRPAGGPGDLGRAFVAARDQAVQRQLRARHRPRQGQHLQLPAPVARRALPVRLRGRGSDGRRRHRHLRPGLRHEPRRHARTSPRTP